MKTMNPYQIKWAIYVDKNNVMDNNKNVFSRNEETLLEKLKGKKGRYFIITDKQFGLIQNNWGNTKELIPNTKLSYHISVKSTIGCNSMIPMTKKQFENPIIL